MSGAAKAIRSPSFGVVIFLGFLTASFAALLAFANLATQSVQEVRALPDAANRQPGSVYYIKGSTGSSTRWRSVRNQILRGAAGSAQLTESDLNGWAASTLASRGTHNRPSKEGERAPKAPLLWGLEVNVSGLNFRIVDGLLQVAAQIEIPKLLSNKRFVYQVRGDLRTASGGGLKFVAREGTIGRAPFAQIPLVGGFVHQRIANLLLAAPEAAELSKHWSSIKGVKIEGSRIELTLE